MRHVLAAIVWVLLVHFTSPDMQAQDTMHIPVGVASDWTHHHVLFPASGNLAITARLQNEPRFAQSWLFRHSESWWPEFRRAGRHKPPATQRDWNVSLGNATFEPFFDFSFDIAPETGYGSLNTTDESNGEYLATAGSLTVTGGNDIGVYTLLPGGPAVTTSPLGSFIFDNLISAYYPSTSPPLDYYGWLFTAPGLEINLWYNPPGEPNPGDYSYYDSNSYGSYPTALNETGTFTTEIDPGGGQTFPAKYVFDVTAAPSCTGDFVAIGIPSVPASGGQANIVGYNNLYSSSSGSGKCSGTGPNVMFAYASGSGEVPASVTLSLNGQQIAYVENLLTGSSYFHVLTLGTTGTNGTSATAAIVPGSTGGNNAVDQRLLLSPDGGTTNQSSTTAPFIDYTWNVAYVTTYSWFSGGSGYLYKISNVFGPGTPAIAWSAQIGAVPSSPVYDTISNRVFFTDSNGRIDYVVDSGSSPSVTYGAVLAPDATSLNPVTVDSVNEMVYATFNTDGSNALVVQAPTSMASSVTVPVGTGTTTYTGPYGVDFNNAWYTGSGAPLLYVAGTGTGTVPTLLSVGFNASGVLNSTANATTAVLSNGMADASAVTEFYNATLARDFLFVGVTDNCAASTYGGNAGCVMSLDITSGFPTFSSSSPAIAAAGGSSGIIVDNDANTTTYPQSSSCYYATKIGATLVKATQSGLN